MKLMKMDKSLALGFTILTLCGNGLTQRSPYAGRRPIGYPELNLETITTPRNGLTDKFGEGGATVSTERLPIEALGDRQLVERISKLPMDKQPFWYLNRKALEENRKSPHTYAQKPNLFVDIFPSVTNLPAPAITNAPTPMVNPLNQQVRRNFNTQPHQNNGIPNSNAGRLPQSTYFGLIF